MSWVFQSFGCAVCVGVSSAVGWRCTWGDGRHFDGSRRHFVIHVRHSFYPSTTSVSAVHRGSNAPLLRSHTLTWRPSRSCADPRLPLLFLLLSIFSLRLDFVVLVVWMSTSTTPLPSSLAADLQAIVQALQDANATRYMTGELPLFAIF